MISQGTIQKWIAVGDRNQAIYGFSGATSNSFDMFLTKSDNVVEMPLDICYRSDTSIVEAANVIYPVMIAASTQPGTVMTSSNIDEIEENSMVICRNTAPLFELYFELLGRGKPSYINGSDIMAYLIKFLKPYIKHNVHSATIEMKYKYEDLQENSSEEGKFQLYIFEQNFENFLNVATHVCKPTDSMEYVIEKLKHLFENRNNAIMLCTIHKSKGLEANTVYILNEHLIPSRFAKSEEQLIQEKNLKYVARTRAKNKLVYLNLKMKSDPKAEVVC